LRLGFEASERDLIDNAAHQRNARHDRRIACQHPTNETT
jgi:hypothetical protein